MARLPLYKAAETEMIRRISAGEWSVGQRLPNEFGLADEFGVSQGTMRRALMTLEGMGLLHRKPGRGTIVSEPPQPSEPSTAAAVVAGGLVSEGGAPDFEVFRARSGKRGATTEEAALFGTARVSVVERTLKLRGDRAALDEIVVPEALAASLDEGAPVDLAAFLAAHGLTAAHVDVSLGAQVTDMGQSVALAVDRHTGLLRVEARAKDSKGRALARQILRISDPSIRFEGRIG